MAESVIADFVGGFNSEVTTRDDPIQGRVVLSQRRLVLAATEDERLTIPLSAIFDIAIGHVPPDLGDFFKSTVTIAFERGDGRHVAAIEADDDTITKFATVLFKAICNDTPVTVKERARVGGRVTDEVYRSAKLFLEPGGVEFRRSDDAFEVALGSVTEFTRDSREIDGTRRPILQFSHMKDGTAVTTEAAIPSPRKLSILGRYLRLEYTEIVTELNEIDLTTEQVEALVAIYSTAGADVPLAAILEADAAAVTMLLDDLEADGLVERTDDGPTLTPMGEVVASQQVESVNG